MIKIILFDLGNVVVPFNFQAAIENFLPLCPVEGQQVIDFFLTSEEDRLFVEGKITAQDFYHAAQKKLQFNMSFESFAKRYTHIFGHNKQMEDLIHELKDNYKLAILSNTNALHFPFIKETYEIMKVFDTCIVSYEEKCQKPSCEIFVKTIQRLKTQPNEILFIDDTEINVHAAVQIGMKAIHYKNIAALKEEIQHVH